MHLLRRKKVVLPLGIVAAVAIAAGAYAYWTTSGSGTGSGSVGTSSTVTVTQVGTISGLAPGSAAQAVDFKITNPKSSPQFISSVSVSISGVNAPAADATHPCTASDFTVTQPNAISSDLASGDTTFSASGATLAMKDTASNQDGCKGATVNLAFSAS
jgi:hypothetical protein